MQSSFTSLSSIYGSQTILDVEDLLSAPSRCRSSIISFVENESPSRRLQLPSNRSITKCHHLFRTCLSSPLALFIQKKLLDHTFRKQYFTKLCHNHRLLLVLNDYQCKCGCHFSMQQESFVILYERKSELLTWNKTRLVTVISNELLCSKVPSHFLCDVDLLRQRVRSRSFYSNKQSFDL